MLSPETPTHDSSLWPGLPHSIVAGAKNKHLKRAKRKLYSLYDSVLRSHSVTSIASYAAEARHQGQLTFKGKRIRPPLDGRSIKELADMF